MCFILPQLRDRLSTVCDNHLSVQQDILESFVDRRVAMVVSLCERAAAHHPFGLLHKACRSPIDSIERAELVLGRL